MYFNPRSPHGERPEANDSCEYGKGFQSTLSSRRATLFYYRHVPMGDISIHALLTESDSSTRRIWRMLTPISIHALLTESDAHGFTMSEYIDEFQSTLSSRRATGVIRNLETARGFQSTLSSRRATDCGQAITPSMGFQSTLSSRRATGAGAASFSPRDFNPRSPHGERLVQPDVRYLPVIFQSTLSSRRATVRPGIV